jgi:hypothetical protein
MGYLLLDGIGERELGRSTGEIDGGQMEERKRERWRERERETNRSKEERERDKPTNRV